ncbi:D-glycerate dehydrogenase [Devosia neptuniae]|jgi:glyoxylate reductase|uniref:2-hydroxyacid dehydrogenase n=1 Tax=Devosia TaxID=46913 RepID=UPI0022AF1D3F|nr:D-glycerate dehydrogenase [Devosia neptuniae]MCZ4347758.1 D-glycerate dehydrogenase [Devosia neptuniae]|tara:strand:+ start:2022 stop:3035 length:1014 start_codon:yes stop_codon:yes gene_type:complete
MASQKPKILVTRRLPESIESRMATLFETDINDGDITLTSDDIIAGLEGKDVLVCSITDTIDAALISRLPQSVRLIAQFGNGIDNIDVEAAWAAGLTVTNTPSVLTEDTADMAMVLMLALPRRLVEGTQMLVRDGVWAGWSPTSMLGHRLRGKALGIVGMGRIGTAVAQRAKAFGLNIHYYSRNRRPPAIEDPLEATYWHDLDSMIAAVDIVSLHTPHTRETFHLLSAKRLAGMKPGSFVVNVSRPELIDETALVAEIESGHLSGAALDVFENKNGINPRLLALAEQNKVVLTAHMASATLEARVEMGETVIVNIRAFMDGHQPPHRVLPEGGRGTLS